MEKEGESDLTKVEKRSWQSVKSRRNLHFISITFMMNISAYQGVLGLESSMNVEEGLGTISVMVIFITSAVSCVTFVPFMIDFFGSKTAIIIGEIGMIVYVVANFYPNWYTIIFASIFHGLTESAPWCGSSVYVSLLGQQRWTKQKSKELNENLKTKDSYVVRFFGKFYVMTYLGDVLGFGLTTLVLMAFNKNTGTKSIHSNATYNGYEGTTIDSFNRDDDVLQINETMKINYKLQKCGSKDCQNEYIYNSTEEELENFNPDPTGTYVLLGLFVSSAAIGVILQAIFLAPAPAKFDEPASDEDSLPLAGKEFAMPSKTSKMIKEVRDVIRHLSSPQHLLVVPLLFYYGLQYSYTITEYTRAFVSCTVGVEKVGFALALSALSAILTSLVTPVIILKFGRATFICLMGAVHGSVYLICLFWLPNQHNLWINYLIGILLGICEGSIVCLYQGLIALYFEKNLGIAFSSQNLVTNLGIVASTSWSTSLCSYVKTYIQLGGLALALLGVIAAEIRFRSKEHFKNAYVETDSLSE